MGLLASSPEISVFYELFHPHTLKLPAGLKQWDVAAELARRETAPLEWLGSILATASKPVSGFKIFDGHNGEVLRYLIREPSIRKIVLFRENFLAVHSSVLISAKKAVWSSQLKASVEIGNHDPAAYEWTETITFERDVFEKRWRRYLSYYDAVTTQLVNVNQYYMFMEYAELLNEQLVRRAFPFLGAAQPESLRSDMSKNNTSSLLDRFNNPDAVYAYLKEINKLDWLTESFWIWKSEDGGKLDRQICP